MYHLSRIQNGFIRALGSAANEESAKNLLSHYEPAHPEWIQQDDGTWLSKISDYYFYTIEEDGKFGGHYTSRGKGS